MLPIPVQLPDNAAHIFLRLGKVVKNVSPTCNKSRYFKHFVFSRRYVQAQMGVLFPGKAHPLSRYHRVYDLVHGFHDNVRPGQKIQGNRAETQKTGCQQLNSGARACAGTCTQTR